MHIHFFVKHTEIITRRRQFADTFIPSRGQKLTEIREILLVTY